jgi:ribosomal protein L35
MKTVKTYTKRLRVTKNGKILARKQGQDHFNAKERRSGKAGKKGMVNTVIGHKEISRFQLN